MFVFSASVSLSEGACTFLFCLSFKEGCFFVHVETDPLFLDLVSSSTHRSSIVHPSFIQPKPQLQIARIALPVPVDRLYSYHVPEHFQGWVRPGRRVVVPFGKRKLAGVVIEEGSEADLKKYKARDILDVDVELPLLSEELLDLTKWVATYYMCSHGEAARAALPPGSSSATARSRVKTETLITLSPDAPHAPPRGSRQMEIIEQMRVWEAAEALPVSQSRVLAECGGSSAVIRRLVEMGYLETETQEVDRSRSDMTLTDPDRMVELHPAQKTAVEAIEKQLADGSFRCFLLHGVTGSGKTEVYLQALEKARKEGKNGIILVPEISLTPQTVSRFRARFGDDVAVLHSRMSPGERYDAWRGIGEGRFPIVIGPRSAILAPMPNPGLIIVDEEHESSYKQFDPAPRYHARDVAVIRAMKNGATCILGSATPSLESLSNARSGKYTLLEMPERVPVRGVPARLPNVRVVDLRNEHSLKESHGVLSSQLLDAIAERIEK